MKKLFSILLLLSSSLLFSQQEVQITDYGKDMLAFVPDGWKIITSTAGDLNKDKADDIAIVIEDTNKENFIENEFLGAPILNINPRYLLILFKEEKGYRLAGLNRDFIPSQNDAESSCLEDPFMESGGMEIKNGVLSVSFHYWLSCGSYGVTNECFKLRWQDGKFVLIGYDHSEFSRSSGEESLTSINFLTKKKSETNGGNMFADGENNPKTVWKKIKIDKFIMLQDLDKSGQIDFFNL